MPLFAASDSVGECHFKAAESPTLLFYLRTSSSWAPSPSGTLKRKAGRSDSIQSIGAIERMDNPLLMRYLQTPATLSNHCPHTRNEHG